MGREEDRARIAQRPNSVRFAELAGLLEAYGWRLDRVSGSHYYYRRRNEGYTLPYRRGTLLPAYVRGVLARTGGSDD